MTVLTHFPPDALRILCAMIPPLCRLTACEDVHGALLSVAVRPGEATVRELHRTLLGHEDWALALAPLNADPDREDTLSLLDASFLDLMSLCSQCTAGEMLTVLTRCIVPPTMEALALLLAEHRQQEAQRLYAAQLLWRIQGDERIPDAIALFGHRPTRTAQDIRQTVLNHLKEGGSHA